MKAGIDVLLSIENKGRKIAVLADMKELGDNAPQFHYEVGEYISGKKVDAVALLGSLAEYIGDGITQNNSVIKVFRFMEKEELKGYLDSELKSGDAVLFKGSNSMNLGEISSFYLKKKSE